MYGFSRSEKHKVFISFYHQDNSRYKEEVVERFGDKIIDKSVSDGNYDSNNGDGYIKRHFAGFCATRMHGKVAGSFRGRAGAAGHACCGIPRAAGLYD